MAELRSLVRVPGDPLVLEASAFDDVEPGPEAVWMAEMAEESTHVPSVKPPCGVDSAADLRVVDGVPAW